jgi:hypothetical protein
MAEVANADRIRNPRKEGVNMIVSRDADGHLVPLMKARDASGQTFLEALESMPEESKRQTRVALRLHYGLPADPLDEFPIN